MSSSLSSWDRALASADVLSYEECSVLLDSNFFDDDLLKNFPTAAPKIDYPKYHLKEDSTNSLYPPSPPEIKPSPSELANDLLQQLENQCKQENVFPNWFEGKDGELSIYENFSQAPERVEPAAPAAVPVPPYCGAQPMEELLHEFDTVFGVVQLEHLTPPQSPPGPATQLLVNFAQQAQAVLPIPSIPEQWAVVDTPVDYECDLEAVDELVRHRAAQLASPGSSSESPRSSAPSSPRSSTDDEWAGSSRPKPYSRGPDDRRSRKKEQNKNAATRYRQKKKAEIEVLLGEEQTLRQRHSALDDQRADLERDIRYLKGLMRDMFKAKGLIK